MIVYLLDTHAVYWHSFEPAKLSASAKLAITDGEAGQALLVVSHVVLAELYFLLKKLGRDGHFSNIIAAIRRNSNYRIEAVVLEDVEALSKYPEVPEMHDRLLVAQANRLGATLITKDRNIQLSPQVKWLW